MINRANRNRYKLRNCSKNSSYRLSVFRSNNHMYAQVVDCNGRTLVSSNSASKECPVFSESKLKKATWVGENIVSKLKDKSIKIYFDRGSYKYHGVVKALADAARNAGLGF